MYYFIQQTPENPALALFSKSMTTVFNGRQMAIIFSFKKKPYLKQTLILFFVVLTFNVLGQNKPRIESYQHFSIHKNQDTVNYHIYAKNEIAKLDGLILFIQGSGSNPLFTIKTEGDTQWISSGISMFDLDKIPKNLALIVISKKGIPFVDSTNREFKTPNVFYKTESLDYRVWQCNEVLKHIIKKQIKNPKKVIVLGHSEGTDVAAKLGTINKKISHIGYWAGGGGSQYYDFSLFIRKEVAKGNITEEQAMLQMDTLMTQLKSISANENSINDFWQGHTYRRWSKFSEPSIDNLLKIKIPIFVALGAKDESVPIESSYLIPIEFIRHKKENLTFKVYPKLNHSFQIPPQNEKEKWQFHWMDVFEEFIKWTDK